MSRPVGAEFTLLAEEGYAANGVVTWSGAGLYARTWQVVAHCRVAVTRDPDGPSPPNEEVELVRSARHASVGYRLVEVAAWVWDDGAVATERRWLPVYSRESRPLS